MAADCSPSPSRGRSTPPQRETAARTRAEQRLRRQRNTLRPLGVFVIAAVAIGAFNGHPTPGAHGEGLALAGALLVFATGLAFAVRNSFIDRPLATQTAVIAAVGAAGVGLVALQPHGTTELAAGAAVWLAVARLPLALGVLLAGATTVGVALAEALAGASAAVVLAAVLLCTLLGLVGYFLKQDRASQDTTELLLAQLEDAREEQLQAAAVSERGRIASELHDVLAHSLSGAAIQLQGARKLAERERASAQLRAAIERAGELVRDGLVSARQAVGALRGDDMPGVGQLESLVARFRDDTATDVRFTVEGEARSLPADAGLALPRRPGGAHQHRPLRTRRHHHRGPPLRRRRHLAHRRGPARATATGCRPGRDWRRERPQRHATAARARRRPHACRSDRYRLACRAGGARMIRVLIADDQRAVREGLAMLVGLTDDIEVVATAADGRETVTLAGELRPDVVLMDLRMPQMEGAEATRTIRTTLPDTHVLVLTTYADDDSLFPALKAGAHGYLTKDASAEEIERAIRAVADGHTHLDSAIQQRLVTAILETTLQTPTPPDDLTGRELEVLKLIAAGLSNTEIAAALVLSAATVKTHVNHIFQKTGARDRAQAVRYAYHHGLT